MLTKRQSICFGTVFSCPKIYLATLSFFFFLEKNLATLSFLGRSSFLTITKLPRNRGLGELQCFFLKVDLAYKSLVG